jgi:hypothetical protein
MGQKIEQIRARHLRLIQLAFFQITFVEAEVVAEFVEVALR